jgi:hypothetical protein
LARGVVWINVPALVLTRATNRRGPPLSFGDVFGVAAAASWGGCRGFCGVPRPNCCGRGHNSFPRRAVRISVGPVRAFQCVNRVSIG